MATTPADHFARPPGATSGPTPDDLLEAFSRGRRRLMITGVLLMVLGAVAIIVPAVASVTVALFIGWILVIASAFEIVNAYAVPDRRRMLLRFVFGALTLAAGLYLLLAPLDGVYTLTVVLVIWFIAVGTARVILGLAERDVPGGWMTVASGAISIFLGFLIAAHLPSSADWAIGLIVGVDLLFSGTVLTALAYRLKSVVP
jgi:uncharacterized membrane protein HdeD (DUF308 family)